MLVFVIQILTLLGLSIVAIQDYRYRGVSWFLFPLLAISALCGLWLGDTLRFFLPLMVVNFVFVFILLSGLTLYFSLKNGKLVNIADTYIGWGDILFFGILAMFFSPLNLLMFVVGSLIVVVLIVALNPRLRRNIPLAGIQASLLIFLILLRFTPWSPDFHNDMWIVSWLERWN